MVDIFYYSIKLWSKLVPNPTPRPKSAPPSASKGPKNLWGNPRISRKGHHHGSPTKFPWRTCTLRLLLRGADALNEERKTSLKAWHLLSSWLILNPPAVPVLLLSVIKKRIWAEVWINRELLTQLSRPHPMRALWVPELEPLKPS